MLEEYLEFLLFRLISWIAPLSNIILSISALGYLFNIYTIYRVLITFYLVYFTK